MLDILFVNPTYEKALRREINGTLLLATKLLQADFQVEVLRFCEMENFNKDYPAFIREMLDEILARKPRCVSFYCLWPDYHVSLRLAKELKAVDPSIVTVFGGPQASMTPSETMDIAPYIDYLSAGEGENTVVPLFSYILRGEGDRDQIPGLYYHAEGVLHRNEALPPLCDLNTLPLWDKRLIPDYEDPGRTKPYYYMPIDAGRGCPFRCTFCCTSYFWQRNYRMKSPERIIQEVKFFHDNYGIRSFLFSHDAFTVNKKLVESVCDKILEEGLDISWECSTRMDCVTEELLLKMKKAGMTNIQMGVETGSPRMQKLTNKKLDLDRIRKMARFLFKNQVYCVLFFMYGFPEETEEDLNQTLEMIFSLMDGGNKYFSMSLCRFTPNTAITNQYLDQLEFDPKMMILYHDIFGFEEERELICNNRSIFPFYYNLKTDVRNNYQYLHFLVELCMKCNHPARQLRRIYNGDYIQFYRDFCAANREIVEGSAIGPDRWFEEHPLEAMLNIVALRNDPFRKELEGLLRYAYALHRITEATEDMTIRDTYDFNYVDLKLKHPISQFTPGRSEILLERIHGKVSVRVLDIRWD